MTQDHKAKGVLPSDEPNAAELVARLRGGDPTAAQLLEAQFRERLVLFCWGYLGSREEAEDAVQEVCYKVLSAGQIPSSFRSWLYRIARNQCLNMLRTRARRPDRQVLADASRLDATLTGQLTRLVRKETRDRLADAVAQLPEAVREVLRLRYVEDLSRTEIAEVLEVDESVVKLRLFEGLQQLRQFVPLGDQP